MQNKQKTKYGIGFLMSIILFIIFVYLGSKVKGLSAGIYFDESIILYFRGMMTPNIKRIMIFISYLGSSKLYIFLCTALLVYFIKKKYYVNSLALINGVLGSAVINFLIKAYYVRIRPEKYFQIQESGFSFPSGHSMVATSFYFILVYVLFRNKPWDIKKVISWILAVMLVCIIGLSRICLGVHWPTDVIGGLSLGFIWAYLNMIMIELLTKNSKQSDS